MESISKKETPKKSTFEKAKRYDVEEWLVKFILHFNQD
jgi:hypothetical protein